MGKDSGYAGKEICRLKRELGTYTSRIRALEHELSLSDSTQEKLRNRISELELFLELTGKTDVFESEQKKKQELSEFLRTTGALLGF